VALVLVGIAYLIVKRRRRPRRTGEPAADTTRP
jgi:hypothetical protein